MPGKSPNMSDSTALRQDEGSCPQDPYNVDKRHEPAKANVVFGHPSVGGILILEASRVEMEYLGISEDETLMRSPEQGVEDKFCERIRRFGAQWWQHDRAWTDAMIGEGDAKKYFTTVLTAWPSDGKGVWVLKYDREEWSRGGNMKKANLAGRLTWARDMGERMALIREFGGRYFEDPDDCDDLRMDTMKQNLSGTR
jgi:hypothetical protein